MTANPPRVPARLFRNHHATASSRSLPRVVRTQPSWGSFAACESSWCSCRMLTFYPRN